jgi:hypothetical protein
MRQEDDKNVRRLASKFILEVAGYSPVKKQFNVGTQVPPDQFIEAVARMEQADAARDRKDEWAFKLPEAKDANCG